MAKKSVSGSLGSRNRSKPAFTPEARENQLISRAMDLAEKQMMEGTASSQVILHFLKLGSSRERLEQKKLERDIAMLEAKKNSLESSQRTEETYAKALEAMRRYSGMESVDDD